MTKLSEQTPIERDLLRSVNWSNASIAWMTLLVSLFIICMYFYIVQLVEGLGVTGLHDYASWGMYISNFVFFVATSLVGMLISSVMGLAGAKWITPISRIAEIIAVAFAMVAGLVIVSDMGRPDRVLNVILHGRIQSPIVWDITVITTYVMLSSLLLYIPLIPDMAICRDKLTHLPKWQQLLYKMGALGYNYKAEQLAVIKKAIRILLVLIIPVALAIHTVTSWLFAATLRIGWDTSIFGPYFVSGAFVAGSAAVIVAMFFYRKNYKLSAYLTDKHFDHMGKLLVLVSLVYLYFNINEILVPAYKMKQGEDVHMMALFTGHYAIPFWFSQVIGLLIPIILLIFKPFRKPIPITIIASIVLIAAWVKRFLIVIPTQLHPYLPIQTGNPGHHVYHPTVPEIAITAASFILVLIIVTILSKLFPIIPIWEMEKEAKGESTH